MKAKDIKTWTKALRSGEYSQVKGHLHRNGGFCCLGVLLDVMVEGDWISPAKDGDPWRFRCDGMTEKYTGMLPRKIRGDLNISADTERELIDMNDSGASFEEIADWIESNMQD